MRHFCPSIFTPLVFLTIKNMIFFFGYLLSLWGEDTGRGRWPDSLLLSTTLDVIFFFTTRLLPPSDFPFEVESFTLKHLSLFLFPHCNLSISTTTPQNQTQILTRNWTKKLDFWNSKKTDLKIYGLDTDTPNQILSTDSVTT